MPHMDDEMETDRCMRAAEAAIAVVREECSEMDVEVREVGERTFMEIPEDAAEMMDDAGESPVPFDNFTTVVEESNFVREWLGGRSVSGGVDPDPDSEAFASVVYNLAVAIFDDGLAFSVSDLQGSEALREIAQST